MQQNFSLVQIPYVMNGKTIFFLSTNSLISLTQKFVEVEYVNIFNPLVPDAHYSERRDKLVSLQNKQLKDNQC